MSSLTVKYYQVQILVVGLLSRRLGLGGFFNLKSGCDVGPTAALNRECPEGTSRVGGEAASP